MRAFGGIWIRDVSDPRFRDRVTGVTVIYDNYAVPSVCYLVLFSSPRGRGGGYSLIRV